MWTRTAAGAGATKMGVSRRAREAHAYTAPSPPGLHPEHRQGNGGTHGSQGVAWYFLPPALPQGDAVWTHPNWTPRRACRAAEQVRATAMTPGLSRGQGCTGSNRERHTDPTTDGEGARGTRVTDVARRRTGGGGGGRQCRRATAPPPERRNPLPYTPKGAYGGAGRARPPSSWEVSGSEACHSQPPIDLSA
jgi:hypothetical protein